MFDCIVAVQDRCVERVLNDFAVGFPVDIEKKRDVGGIELFFCAA